jgi:hypothetical protein
MSMNFAGLDQKRRRRRRLTHKRTKPLCGGRPKRAMREGHRDDICLDR